MQQNKKFQYKKFKKTKSKSFIYPRAIIDVFHNTIQTPQHYHALCVVQIFKLFFHVCDFLMNVVTITSLDNPETQRKTTMTNFISDKAEILRDCSSTTMPHMSCVTCHVSCVRCQVSSVKCGFVINRATPSSFIRARPLRSLCHQF